MKYYIYGQGTNGLGIADFLDIYCSGIEYIFIDDNIKAHSFEVLYSQITQKDIVLVASTKHFKKIAAKLEEKGICYTDGVKWCGDFINELIAKIKIERQKSIKYIGIILTCWENENKFVGIDENLKEMGNEIIYFVFTKALYDKYKNKGICIFAPHSILEEVVNVDLMLTVNGDATSRRVASINFTHGFQGMSVFPFEEINYDLMKETLSKLNYYICSSKRIQSVNQKYLEFYGAETQLLPLGYMPVDNYFDIYQEYLKNHLVKFDYVLIAFSFPIRISKYKTLIKAIRNANKKAIICPHPTYEKSVYDEIKELVDNKNVFLNKSFPNRWEMFAQSCCLITECSSVGYTYSLTTAKPTIIFYENRAIYFDENLASGYFDDKIHFFCENAESLTKTINGIEGFIQEYQQRIEKYRKEECFFFGKSKEKILEWICQFLDK